MLKDAAGQEMTGERAIALHQRKHPKARAWRRRLGAITQVQDDTGMARATAIRAEATALHGQGEGDSSGGRRMAIIWTLAKL